MTQSSGQPSSAALHRDIALAGITVRTEYGTTILSPAERSPTRRVLFVNSYGGREVWQRIHNGLLPSHHLWGCVQLVQRGYEVALAEPLVHYTRRCAVPHDARLFKFVQQWLGRDGVLYCGHTLLYWLPLLKSLRALRCPIVSLTYAREPLDWARQHTGIIGMTAPAAENARRMAPKAKVAHLGWGVDLDFFPLLPYDPENFLSCGRTHRDHQTLALSAAMVDKPLRVISPDLPEDVTWPSNVSLVTGGRTDDTVPYRDLLYNYYAKAIAALIILKYDPDRYTAVGFTNLIESMAMGRPAIVSRTGAIPLELDVESAGCGVHVPAEDPNSLAAAMRRLCEVPEEAVAMGLRGRRLAETHYNIDRFTNDLHSFFESL